MPNQIFIMNHNLKIKAFFFLLIAAAGILAIHVSTAGEMLNLPLSITLDNKDDGNLVLNITNSTEINSSLVSNIPNIIADLFQGFPTRGAFQFKASNGTIAEFMGEQTEGWRSPSLYSSHIDLNRNKKLDQLEEIVVSSKQTKSYPINIQNVFQLAIKDQQNTSNSTLAQFRVKLSIKVKTGMDKQTEIDVVSNWSPLIKGTKNE
jgi:hypothetical protein